MTQEIDDIRRSCGLRRIIEAAQSSSARFEPADGAPGSEPALCLLFRRCPTSACRCQLADDHDDLHQTPTSEQKHVQGQGRPPYKRYRLLSQTICSNRVVASLLVGCGSGACDSGDNSCPGGAGRLQPESLNLRHGDILVPARSPRSIEVGK